MPVLILAYSTEISKDSQPCWEKNTSNISNVIGILRGYSRHRKLAFSQNSSHGRHNQNTNSSSRKLDPWMFSAIPVRLKFILANNYDSRSRYLQVSKTAGARA